MKYSTLLCQKRLRNKPLLFLLFCLGDFTVPERNFENKLNIFFSQEHIDVLNKDTKFV
jgi:hypothetical protein